MLTDTQIYLALAIAIVPSLQAIRLGLSLYE